MRLPATTIHSRCFVVGVFSPVSAWRALEAGLFWWFERDSDLVRAEENGRVD